MSRSTTAGIVQERPGRPPRPVTGPSGYPLALASWDGLAVTAQIPRRAAVALGALRVGDVAELDLVIVTAELAPCFVGADRWRTDERGLVDARGTVLLAGEHSPRCVPPVLEVAGRRWPLADVVDEAPGTRIELAGALYATAPGSGVRTAAGVVVSRTDPLDRLWAVRALRRYAPGDDGVVGVSMRELPAPDDADGRTVVVADLGPVRGRR